MALTPDRAVWDRALAGQIMLCSWTRRFIATVPLSIRGKDTDGFNTVG